MSALQYSLVRPALAQSNLTTVAQYMFWLMFRNVASDGFVFEDPVNRWCPVATRVRARLTVVGEQRHARVPGLRLQLDPRRRDRRDRAGGRPAAHQPAADRLCAVRADLPELGRRLRSRVVLDQRHSAEAGPTRPTGRPCRHWRSCSCSPSSTRRRRPWRTPVIAANLNFLQNAYQGADVQPLGGGERRLVLRALRAAEVLSGDHGQHPRDPGPGLAERRHTVARERPRKSLERSVLPVAAPCPDRLQSPVRPQHRHRHGGDLRRRRSHRHEAPCDRRARCAASGPTRPRSTSTRSTGPISNAASVPCSGATQATSTTVTPMRRWVTTPGRCPRPTSPSSTTGWRSRSPPPERFRSTISRPASSDQVGVAASATPAAAAAALQSAGDQMLQAVVFHSDHFELSEQFDATSGYEKSVSNLSWSYASFLSAARA